MISIFIYLAKAAGLITLFFSAYYLLLKKETFFTSIRFFLLAGIVTSFLLPLVTFTKTIWITTQPLPQIITTGNTFTQTPPIENTGFEIEWWNIATGIYALGVIFFAIRFIRDIIKVTKLLNRQSVHRDGSFKMIDSEKIASPFSFFYHIVYNSSVLTSEELTSIITHEKVHSRQLHSIDMLLSQIASIFLWFNPMSWLYKKIVSQNLEFIADAEAAKTILDIKTYQKTLLKITLQPECIPITNHFYQSLIKKRIVMLNKKQSEKYNFWKFSVVLPALAVFMYTYQTDVVAKEKVIEPNDIQNNTIIPKAIKSISDQSVTDTIKKNKTSVISKDITPSNNDTETLQEKNRILVVNGVIQTNNTVYPKGKEMVVTELSGEEAVKKYGDKGKFGATEYTTTVDFDPNSTEPKITSITHTKINTNISTDINTSITDNVKQMNASPYRTVNVTTLYDNDGTEIVNDGKNIYFTINNTTTDIQLNGYKEDLAKEGITTEFSEIERDSRGKITGIKISISDKKRKSSATWSSNRNKDGIPNIYIGRIKGRLTASSRQ